MYDIFKNRILSFGYDGQLRERWTLLYWGPLAYLYHQSKLPSTALPSAGGGAALLLSCFPAGSPTPTPPEPALLTVLSRQGTGLLCQMLQPLRGHCVADKWQVQLSQAYVLGSPYLYSLPTGSAFLSAAASER